MVTGSQRSWFWLRALLRCACWSLDAAFEEMELEKRAAFRRFTGSIG